MVYTRYVCFVIFQFFLLETLEVFDKIHEFRVHQLLLFIYCLFVCLFVCLLVCLFVLGALFSTMGPRSRLSP